MGSTALRYCPRIPLSQCSTSLASCLPRTLKSYSSISYSSNIFKTQRSQHLIIPRTNVTVVLHSLQAHCPILPMLYCMFPQIFLWFGAQGPTAQGSMFFSGFFVSEDPMYLWADVPSTLDSHCSQSSYASGAQCSKL